MKQNKVFWIFIVGLLLITVLDVLGSLASKRFSFNYSYLLPFSLLIYILTAHYIWRNSDIKTAVFLTSFLGMADGSAGFYLSSELGAFSPVKDIPLTPVLLVVMALLMACFGALVGALTAGVSSEFSRRSGREV